MSIVTLSKTTPVATKGITSYPIVTPANVKCENMMLTVVTIEPGFSMSAHSHSNSELVYYVINGEATVVLGQRKHTVGPGSAIYVPKGVNHGWFRVKKRLTYVAAIAPPIEEQYKSLYDNWKRDGF